MQDLLEDSEVVKENSHKYSPLGWLIIAIFIDFKDKCAIIIDIRASFGGFFN